MEIYMPDIYQMSIYTIDYEKLKSSGIKLLLFDLDNTIVPSHIKTITPKIKKQFEKITKSFKVILFSNSRKKRVSSFANKLNLDFISFAMKPLQKNFLKAIKIYKFDISEIAIIGDQIMTDIKGGNKAGITTILINRISTKDFFLTKFFRHIENKKIETLRKNDLFKKGRYYE